MKATLSSLAAGSSKNKFKQNCFINNYTTAPNGLVAMAISYRITSIQIKKKNNNKRNWAEDEQCNRWMGKGGEEGERGGRACGWTDSRAEPVLCYEGLWGGQRGIVKKRKVRNVMKAACGTTVSLTVLCHIPKCRLCDVLTIPSFS